MPAIVFHCLFKSTTVIRAPLTLSHRKNRKLLVCLHGVVFLHRRFASYVLKYQSISHPSVNFAHLEALVVGDAWGKGGGGTGGGAEFPLQSVYREAARHL